jgi:phosphoglycolate phosphatase
VTVARFDILMAHAAGCRSIGVAWGYGGADALTAAGAHAVAHTPEELATLLGLD